MSYTITSQCIQCDRCLSVCPTQAIQKKDNVLLIDSALCNECVGYHGTAQCAGVCPTNSGIVPLPTTESNHYWDDWFTRYNYLIKKLKLGQRPPYWQNWFDTYSQKLTHLLGRELVNEE